MLIHVTSLCEDSLVFYISEYHVSESCEHLVSPGQTICRADMQWRYLCMKCVSFSGLLTRLNSATTYMLMIFMIHNESHYKVNSVGHTTSRFVLEFECQLQPTCYYLVNLTK